MTAPPLDQRLIKWLESCYPPPIPKLKDTERQIWMKCGNHEVLEKLRATFKLQTQNDKVL